jgi:hypothetical protein
MKQNSILNNGNAPQQPLNQNLSESCDFDESGLYGSAKKKKWATNQNPMAASNSQQNIINSSNSNNNLMNSGSKKDAAHHPHNVLGGKSQKNIIKKSVPLS